MNAFITQLAERHGVRVARTGDGWRLDLPVRGGFACWLDIGPNALDWYVKIVEAKGEKEVYTDWNDYLGYGDSPEADLIADKESDIDWFVERWIASTDVRVTVRKRLLGLYNTTIAQWQHEGGWYNDIMCEPSSEPE